VADLTRDLLAFRKISQAAREVLHELSTRRTEFVAESSQPFLDKLAGTLERLGADLDTQREILSETLNLYMGIVSHRTNKVVSRLTVISIIFLPLTFLCGVYGMNFNDEMMMWELNWRWGYTAFWVAALGIATTLLIYMKKKGWW
jgi:magnesium transporter